MLNKDLFFRDPTDSKHAIPNEGVAKIGFPDQEKEWATLRFELEHFVCEGQYEAGLERIIASYVAHMDQPQQPAVWVSGFFGSGKSHFLKVLENLWNDTRLPDGATARGVAHVSERVDLQLRELTTLGKRLGGLWAAAGTLGAGASGSVRLSFLGIVFGAAGLPVSYPAAKLVMWLKQEDAEDTVREYLARANRTLEKELRNMYVSPHLGEALVAGIPGFATGSAEALRQLREAYPQVDDIDNDEFCDSLRDVLMLVADQQGKPGQLPCTLIVIDELQQYIGEDIDRADKVLRIVEAVVAKFGSHVLFVASGQSAMGGGGSLLRLQDRFTGRVEFTDTDVDRVVRRVVLQKAPEKIAMLEEHLESVSGEINRHLGGTKIRSTAEDREFMAADYPLLPARRRFWEHVLRAIDRGGSSGQLRTQLRSVQEAARYVGDEPIGVVVPGDFIYESQVNAMLTSGVLVKDLHETIEGLRDAASMDGGLKYRAAALVFLIGQLKDANKDLGVRATAATIADLLVANLNEGSSMLRTEVESVLNALAEEGILQSVDGEFSLQGKIGTEWQQDYVQRSNRIKDETARITAVRSTKLQETLQRVIGNLSITQGESKTPRKGQFVYGLEQPDLSTGSIPVWVRDEWTTGSLKTAEADAAARGSEDPVVHLLIPRRDAQAIKDEIVKLEAAQETLDAKGTPTTEEGAIARAGIQSRRDAAEESLRRLMAGLLDDARVFMSGGNEIREGDLAASVKAGLKIAAQRMFPKFDLAEGNWGLVVSRASQGSGDALEVLGHQGEPKDQKVCAEVIKLLGGSGKKGSEVREYFKSRPYGWPQDAIDGALMVLARAGSLRTQLNGVDALANQVTQDKLGKFTFAVEQQPFTANQRLELRKLFADTGVECKPNEEPTALGGFLSQLRAAGESAGGAVPLPPVPDLQPVREIEALSGNEKLVAAWEQRDELRALWRDWQHARSEIEHRSAEWNKLRTLLKKGASLSVAAEIQEQADAIAASRSLLTDPDPVRPLNAVMVDAIREALRARYEEYKEARERGIEELEAVPEYKALSAETWKKIVQDCGLGPLPELDLGTDQAVLAEVDLKPLGMWKDLIEGMKGRIEEARVLFAEAVKPEVTVTPYTPPAARLTSSDEVEAYVTKVRMELLATIKSGSHVVVKR